MCAKFKKNPCKTFRAIVFTTLHTQLALIMSSTSMKTLIQCPELLHIQHYIRRAATGSGDGLELNSCQANANLWYDVSSPLWVAPFHPSPLQYCCSSWAACLPHPEPSRITRWRGQQTLYLQSSWESEDAGRFYAFCWLCPTLLAWNPFPCPSLWV